MSEPSPTDVATAQKVLYTVGERCRREVVGDAHVDRALEKGSSEFSRPMQELATANCWGAVWTRPGLDRKQRSLLNVGMLCALNRSNELRVHVRGAIRNGLTTVEIREAILQVSQYVGMPAGLEGTRVAEEVINEMLANGEMSPEQAEIPATTTKSIE